MFLTIDNNDGQGGRDYSPALLKDAPLVVERGRGRWATCSAGLDLLAAALPVPARRARVLVADDAGTVLFRGFLQDEPAASDAARATDGVEELPRFHAVENDWLTHADAPDELQPATAVEHAIPLCDATLRESKGGRGLRDLATDVSVYGGTEGTSYVTELFRGDGTTQVFPLLHPPFREAGSSVLLRDSFDGGTFNAAQWVRVDTGSYLSVGRGGLRMDGGTGYDGATVLRFSQLVEMGGTLVAEAESVLLNTGSDGVLMGFYDGVVQRAHCTVGIRVRGAAGAHTLVALINGVEQGTAYTFNNGHRYTVRVRLHCAEMQRVRGRYGALVDGVLQTFGGDAVDAPMHAVVEAVDAGLASSTLPTVLYDGSMAASPLRCVFAPVNSVSIAGSVEGMVLRQTGSAWAVSTAADGTRTARREGTVGTGADFALSGTGVLTFDPGRVPQPGELLTVRYRRGGRAGVRLRDADADTERMALALPGLPQWHGSVGFPTARSSADCNAAAQALLALATGAETAHSGSLTWAAAAVGNADVKPGDTLLLTGTAARRLAVQSVTVSDGNCAPECNVYTAHFAQDRSSSLSFTLIEAVPEGSSALPIATTDAALPASLAGLQVISATTSALQMDSGEDAPNGGGFEVRSSNANFGSALTGDLVLQSPVRSFSLPRTAFAERFFVRMYDGAVPPNYSAQSAVVLSHLPLA